MEGDVGVIQINKLLDNEQKSNTTNSILRKFIMVKTLGDSHPDKHYKITREFHKNVEFYPLEEIKA